LNLDTKNKNPNQGNIIKNLFYKVQEKSLEL